MQILIQLQFSQSQQPCSFSDSPDVRFVSVKFHELRAYRENTNTPIIQHDFRNDSPDINVQLIYGMGKKEEDGIWNTSLKSAFILNIADAPGNLIFEIKYSLLKIFSTGLDVRISFNGEEYRSTRLDGADLRFSLKANTVALDRTAHRSGASETSPRAAIVVLGMHRSGTSALTRLLSLAGASLPRDLMLPKPDNPTGFWESNTIVKANDLVLHALGSRWDDPFEVHADDELRSFALPRLVELIAEDYEDAPLIVIKDPRISLLTRLWNQALKQAGYQVHHVTAVRHPLDVARSLHKRNNMPTDYSVLLWMRYMLAILSSADRGRFVDFDDIIRRPIETLYGISGDTGLIRRENIDDASDAISDFVITDRHRFAQTEQGSSTDHKPAIELYNSVMRSEGDFMMYETELDHARAWFDARTRLLKDAINYKSENHF